MKHWIATLSFLGFFSVSVSGFASNFSPFIRVDDLKAKAANGEIVTFKGGDAHKLAAILPADSFYPGSRSLTITGDKRSIRIECMAKARSVDEGATAAIDPRTTECRIVAGKSFKPDEVELPQVWSP